MTTIALTELKPGQPATVDSVMSVSELSDSVALERLQELGFLPGEPISLLRRGPNGIEPIAVQIGETVFALRLSEARCIQVEVSK